jgi:hypothetical protein
MTLFGTARFLYTMKLGRLFSEKTYSAAFRLCSILVLATPVDAELVSADWKTPDDNLLTVDGNGLEWLDLSETRARSYNDVVAQLGLGGEFEGWRVASSVQVEDFWTAAGGDPAHYDGWSSENFGLYDLVSSYWGDTFCLLAGCETGNGYLQAMTSDVDPDNNLFHVVALAGDTNIDGYTPGQDYFDSTRLSVRIDFGPPATAIALYREAEMSAVPVPAAVWLFGAGLLGLIGFARRKKAT